jgi:hypothetical protein
MVSGLTFDILGLLGSLDAKRMSNVKPDTADTTKNSNEESSLPSHTLLIKCVVQLEVQNYIALSRLPAPHHPSIKLAAT